jgi:hypothetical protein
VQARKNEEREENKKIKTYTSIEHVRSHA